MPTLSEQPYMGGLGRFRPCAGVVVAAWRPRYRILVCTPAPVHADPGDWVVIEDDGQGGQIKRVLPDAAFRALYEPADAAIPAPAPPIDPRTLAAIREEVAAHAARMDQPPSVGAIATGRPHKRRAQ